MTREEFAVFQHKLKNADDNGLNLDAIVKEYEHRNVYFYNDGCIKKILASEKNLLLTTDLLNAALNLVGSDRIENPKLVNPYIPGELGYRSVEPDLLLTNDRGESIPRDRISIDVQHENNDSLFKQHLCYFASFIVRNSRVIKIFHNCGSHISSTKITQFHLVLQDLEHGIRSKLAEIGFTVERIDGTEPLCDAAVVAFELFLLLEKLVHLDECHGLPFKIHTLFLIAQLNLVAIIR